MTLPRSSAAALGFALLVIAAPAANAAVDWSAALRPAAALPRAGGTAQYQAQPGQRELQVEVEHLAKFAGRRLTIYVDRNAVGTAVVTRRGIAQWSRNTELGQPVPRIVLGTRIVIRLGGHPILTGRF